AQQYGALTVFLAAAGSSDTLWPHMCELADVACGHPHARPLAICALLPHDRRAELERRGAMVFSDPSTAIRTIAATRLRPLADAPALNTVNVELPAASGALNEIQSLRVLSG